MAHTLVRNIDLMGETSLQILECELEFQQVSGKNFISVYTFSFLIYLYTYTVPMYNFVSCEVRKKLLHIYYNLPMASVIGTSKLNLHT